MFGDRFVAAFGLAVAVGLFVPTLPAAGETGRFTVRSGVSTRLFSQASYNPDTCFSAPLPRMRVVGAPAHGSVTITQDSFVAKEGNCRDKTLKSVGVVYRSNPGFRGQDTVIVESVTDIYIDGRNERSERFSLIVDVK